MPSQLRRRPSSKNALKNSRRVVQALPKSNHLR
ncbi:hypothetical protein BN1263500076 [Stenotrophomonas indicatrix]|nr:hypothetical protein BN1263500076 [Stenotrophomonas indicatrix]